MIVPLAGFVGGAGVARCVAEHGQPRESPSENSAPWGKTQPIAQCIDTFDMTEYEKRVVGALRATGALITTSCDLKQKQLSATDILALATMKNAAKCDT